MSITVECRRCGRGYKVREEASGKRIECKECGTPIQVPRRKRPEYEDDFLSDFDDEWDSPPAPRRTSSPPARRRASKRPKKRGGKRRKQGNQPARTLALIGGIPFGLFLLFGVIGSILTGSPEPILVSLGSGIGVGLFFILIGGVWEVFEKAGQPGWMCIVPIANVFVLHEIAGVSKWMIPLWFIPLISLIPAIIVFMGVARNFGQSALFGLGLAFLPFIFYPLLGFGDYEYMGY